MPHRLRGVHASLRYDADPAAVSAWLARIVRTLDLDVLTTTESRNPRLARALRKALGPRYRVVRRHEYLHVWRRDTLRGPTRLGRLITASPIWYWMMGKLQRRYLIAAQRLTHRPTGRRGRVTVGHAPSGIDGGAGRWRPGALLGRIPAARGGFARWGRLLRRWQKGDRWQVAALDANLNQHDADWLAYLARTLGGTSLWSTDAPEGGTHGRRLIDTVHLFGVEPVSGRPLRTWRPDGIDHAPVFWEVAL